ncbi:glycine--tRNA ligase subunit beta [Pseudoroseicyclus aestuarii]|uniref:Glycine--tRNA ligase beta subunit n=1 Tax=Pseudoroseicyclus aestuarii TaxID=1795041 RepID=A0A318TBM0_9RHOB|nr:glycine--tRNA ligase subunit beta [Pseudoroseicyclus aestuarii]PYE85738.1 glycyl-tRNA synthetase beta chain [Pseudoroseicyclus aestuarii]
MPDLLIELLSEEIPARMQRRAAEDLKSLVTNGLVEAGLTYAGAAAFSTPRRLALSVEGLTASSPDTREERKGPRVGAPDKAVEGFARGAGVEVSALEKRDAGKGEVYFAVIAHKGRPADAIVAEVLERAIRDFPWPKSMRWGTGDLRWVRPLHGILCILTDEAGPRIVPMEIGGLAAGAGTIGHRFMGNEAFSVSSFEDYEAKLKRAHVILRPEERAETIQHDAQTRAFAQGLELVEDRGLLDEVSGLVEWPVVLMGEIGEEFLHLPPEVLQTSMKEHQKFFSVKDRQGRISRFVTVANIDTPDDGATILAGNGRVLAARLADARFFWDNDLRKVKAGGMEALGEGLEAVTFQSQLGSQADRVGRIAALARSIAPQVGAEADEAEQAARIAKVDLRSEMVGEFPELQGLMGRYYAAEAGLPAAVAQAAEEHYRPLGPSDAVPEAPVSIAVALADKLDTLAGFWAIDEKPTGSKDPFALRRAALGVIRLVLANGLRLPLLPHLAYTGLRATEEGEVAAAHDAVVEAQQGTQAQPDAAADLLGFFHDRLKVHLKGEGLRHDVIDAAAAMPGSDDLWLLVARAQALAGVLKTDDGENLLQGFRRANNILTQAETQDGVEYAFGADRKFIEDPAETVLFDALDAAQPKIDEAMGREDFAGAMAAMAGLRGPIDGFFEAVQVNSENQILRRNRLNLLSRIRTLCLSVADLTRLEG